MCAISTNDDAVLAMLLSYPGYHVAVIEFSGVEVSRVQLEGSVDRTRAKNAPNIILILFLLERPYESYKNLELCNLFTNLFIFYNSNAGVVSLSEIVAQPIPFPGP